MGVVTSHPTDRTLRSYGLGQLAGISSRSVSQHLESCVDCRRRLAEISSDGLVDPLGGDQRQPDQTPASGTPGSRSAEDHLRATAGSRPLADIIPPELASHPDYEVLRVLGRGGMGVVYLAENRLMGRLEVLKVVSGHVIEEPGVRERFLREVQSAAKLQHRNIVTAYSAMRLGANIVLAMEYVEGDDLAKIVKSDGPLPVANACYVIYQAALGLQHAHERGMVHRDIKPANLILAREGTKAIVKVLDFGLAKPTSEGQSDSSLTRVGQMMGTPDFIAPEQIRNTRSADIRADIYSLGCTFYYLLTGGPPFPSEHVWDVYQAHFSMTAGPLNLVRPEIPVELAALVAKMMAKAPVHRFQTPAEVAQAVLPFFQKALVCAGTSYPDVSQLQRPDARSESAGMRPMSAGSATNMAPVPSQGFSSLALPNHPQPAWDSLIKVHEPETLREPAVMARPPRNIGLWSAAAVGAVLLGLAVTWAAVIMLRAPMGVIVLENVPENAVVEVDGDTISVARALNQAVTIERSAGKHEVVVKRGSQVFLAESVSLEAGKHLKLTVQSAPRAGK